MKLSSVAVVCLLLVRPVWGAEEPRIRLLDRVSQDAFERGRRDSATFRELVEDLEASDLIVHVVTSVGLPDSVSGTTRFAGTIGGARYVRIDLASSLKQGFRVAVLAHELQHAREIARSTAESRNAVERLFRAIGKASPVAVGGFETVEAEVTGQAVLAEIEGGRRRARITEQ